MRSVELEHLFTVRFEVTSPQSLGQTPYGERRIVQVTGGSFEGPTLKGKVLPGGGDWLLLRRDGVLQMDVRATLQTDDGALIYMTYRGVRHGPAEVIDRLNRGEAVNPSEYYFRTAPFFETGSEQYAWLNRIVAVATGERLPGQAVYTVYQVL
ncbi:MAG TPA: DUF3237 domain-containing protein [Chloroflexota bacterium]|nr:DUF3237 domain-containing protein [Chloroflexota bacterium]